MQKKKHPRRKKLHRKEISNFNPALTPHLTHLWNERGVEDVSYQRQAQVTWWTILGGICVGALLTQLPTLITAINNGNWFYSLYFLATCLIVINSWVQTAWGSLVLKWPITIPTSIFLFFQGFSMSLAALNITDSNNWYIAISVVIFFAIINQVFFMKSEGWSSFPKKVVHRAKNGILVYIFIFVMTLIASIHLTITDTTNVQIIWGMIGLVTACLALFWQHLGMTEERKLMGIP